MRASILALCILLASCSQEPSDETSVAAADEDMSVEAAAGEAASDGAAAATPEYSYRESMCVQEAMKASDMTLDEVEAVNLQNCPMEFSDYYIEYKAKFREYVDSLAEKQRIYGAKEEYQKKAAITDLAEYLKGEESPFDPMQEWENKKKAAQQTLESSMSELSQAGEKVRLVAGKYGYNPV